MKISDAAVEKLTKSFEGLRLKAYPDPGTGGVPWTIGYGHTRGVKEGDTCTERQADEWLRSDLRWAEEAVKDLVGDSLTQYQFDALVDFVFNIGRSQFEKSTLLKKLILKDYVTASKEFNRWKYAGPKILIGLARRRQAETDWFNGDIK